MRSEEVSVFLLGGKNGEFAKYFVGQSYLNMLATEGVVIGRFLMKLIHWQEELGFPN